MLSNILIENKKYFSNNLKKFKEVLRIPYCDLETIFTCLCLLFLLIGFFLEKTGLSEFSLVSYILSYFFGGYFATIESIKDLLKGKFEIDFLMIFAAVGAAFLGNYSEGALLLFLFSLGGAAEHYALEKAKKQIKELGNLTPPMADVKRNGKIINIPVEDLKINDVVIVKAGSKIPVDGIILSGNSSVNQAPITGESIPVSKNAVSESLLRKIENKSIDFYTLEDKYKVFAGTINGDEVLEVTVSKAAQDSTLARLIKMVNEAEERQSTVQQFTRKIEDYYVPIILVFVVSLCFVFLFKDETPAESFYRAMRVLVGGSPCALAISTPSVVLSGIARAARERVLIKGGKAFETLGNLNMIAFDKTGTLTLGKPVVKNIETYNGMTEEKLLLIMYAIESLNSHPIAKGIVKKCEEVLGDKLNNPDVETENIIKDIKNVSGKGVISIINGEKVYVGNKVLMNLAEIHIPEEIEDKAQNYFDSGHTIIFIATENKGVVGLISLIDESRKEAKGVVNTLKKIGMKHIMMLSGDNKRVVKNVGQELGLTVAKGELLPEDKLTVISRITQSKMKIAMVGDGINDAPAMATSHLGIAMGVSGSDLALETADIALLGDNLENIPFAIELSKKAKKIIRQNLIISLGMMFFLVPASLLGLTEMGLTVILHEGSTVVVVFNALRLLMFKEKEK